MTTSNVSAPQNTPKEYGFSGFSLVFAAFLAAAATATSYLLQPELEVLSAQFHRPLFEVTGAAALAMAGYLFGLALLVPLADRARPHRLIAAQFGIIGVGLALAAFSTSIWLLGVGLFISGAGASVGAQLSSLAGRHSTPGRRGRAVGSVTAGISAGLLLGRIIGGVMADLLGWRGMLTVVAVFCWFLAALALCWLPRLRPKPRNSYRATIASLPKLLVRYRGLRWASFTGALWFFAFSLIWVGLAVALAQPPLNLSPTLIGLYSLAGMFGVLATRIAGSLSDRWGSSRVVLLGLGLAALCSLVMTFSLAVPVLLLISLALFDAGLFAAQVANQSRILSIDTESPAKFNSVYMVVYFIGGTLGTSVAGAVLALMGWSGATLLSLLTIALAAVGVVSAAKKISAASDNSAAAELDG